MYIASLYNDMHFYFLFSWLFALPEAARNPHYLLNIIQFSHSQIGIKPIRVNVTRFVKMCIVHMSDFAHLDINKNHIDWYTDLKLFKDDKGIAFLMRVAHTYTVSTKWSVNQSPEHKNAALLAMGPCDCYSAYVYLQDDCTAICTVSNNYKYYYIPVIYFVWFDWSHTLYWHCCIYVPKCNK